MIIEENNMDENKVIGEKEKLRMETKNKLNYISL